MGALRFGRPANKPTLASFVFHRNVRPAFAAFFGFSRQGDPKGSGRHSRRRRKCACTASSDAACGAAECVDVIAGRYDSFAGRHAAGKLITHYRILNHYTIQKYATPKGVLLSCKQDKAVGPLESPGWLQGWALGPTSYGPNRAPKGTAMGPTALTATMGPGNFVRARIPAQVREHPQCCPLCT